MSFKMCPLCGKPVDSEDEQFCSDCQDLNKQYGSYSHPQTPVASVDKQGQAEDSDSGARNVFPHPVNKRRKKTLTISVALILAIGIAVAVSFFVVNYYQGQQLELQLWNQVLKANTTKSYLAYIEEYPKGEYVKDAQNNIICLNKEVTTMWQNVRSSGNEAELSAFLDKYQHSPYQRQAAMLLDSAAWANALAKNTPDSYKSYIQRASRGKLNGTYRSLAQEKYDYFTQMEFVGGTDLTAVQNLVRTFFATLSAQSYPELEQLFFNPVEQYYRQKNVSVKEVVAFIKSDLSKNGISSVAFSIKAEEMKVQKDLKGNFLIEVDVDKQVAYSKNKNKLNVEAHYAFVLDPAMKITRIWEVEGGV